MLWHALSAVKHGFYIDIPGPTLQAGDDPSQQFFDNGWQGCHVITNFHVGSTLQDRRPGELLLKADGTPFATSPSEGQALAANALKLPESINLDALLPPKNIVHWMRLPIDENLGNLLASWKKSPRPWVVILEQAELAPSCMLPPYGDAPLLEKGYFLAMFDGLRRYYVHESQGYSIAPALSRGLQAASTPPDTTELKRRLFQLETQMRRLQMEAAGNAEAARQLADVLRSSSWRLTKPIRWIKHQALLLKEHGLAGRLRALQERMAAARERQAMQRRTSEQSTSAYSRREQELHALLLRAHQHQVDR